MSVPEIFEKQSWERFYIWGDFVKNAETGEVAVLGTSSVIAEDKNGTEVSDTILDQATKTILTTKLGMRVRAGTKNVSPYKVTFKIVTSLGNYWEVDVMVKIKNL